MSEDNALLRDYVLYPQLTATVQRGLDELEHAHNVLNRAYAASGTYIKQKITADLRENRLALNRKGIRILRSAELNGLIHVEFARKGHTHPETYAVAREVLRDEMRARMAQYIAEFGAVVAQDWKESTEPASIR